MSDILIKKYRCKSHQTPVHLGIICLRLAVGSLRKRKRHKHTAYNLIESGFKLKVPIIHNAFDKP